MIVLAALGLLLALAQEDHRAPAVAAVDVAAVELPAGPPVVARVAPGEDLQARIRSLPAGSSLVLAAGTWTGPVVIDRPLTLSGEAGAVLTGGGQGSVLVIAAPDVTVHDLRITGGGRLTSEDDAGVVVAADRVRLERLAIDDVYLGIDFRMASDGVVRGCTISGDPSAAFGRRGDALRLWESHRNTIEGNAIRDTRDMVVWYAEHNRITGNRVSGSRYGTHLMHSDHNTIAGNSFVDDVVGVFVMYSNGIELLDNVVHGAQGPAGVGFGFKESDEVVVRGNTLVANTTGLLLDTTPHNLGGSALFEGNLVAANEVGLRFHGPQYGGEIRGNAFQANRLPAAADGGVSAGAYRIEHNQWSDYAGYDLDGDGWGDLPFEARSLSGSLVDRVPELALFRGTPAAALIDLFAEAFPMLRPRPVLADRAPAMRWSRP